MKEFKRISIISLLIIYSIKCYCLQISDTKINRASFFEKLDSSLIVHYNGTVTYKWTTKGLNTQKVWNAKIILHFDNSTLNNDSLGNFILISEGKYEQIFLNNILYTVDSNAKSIYMKSTDSVNNRTNEKLLTNCLPLFKWFFRHKSNPSRLNVEHLQSHFSDTTFENRSAWHICFVDTSEILAYDSIQIWTDKSFNLIKFRRDYLDKLASDPAFMQFDNFTYSNKNILKPDSILEGFIKNGYAVKLRNISNGKSPTDIKDTVITKLDFNLLDFDHKQYKLFDFKSKYAVIEFANINCPYCFKSVGMFTSFMNLSHVTALWIDSRDGDEKEYANNIFKKQNIKFPILYDDNQEVLNQYKIDMYPTLFIIDLDTKKILKKIEGYSSENEKIVNDFINFN